MPGREVLDYVRSGRYMREDGSMVNTADGPLAIKALSGTATTTAVEVSFNENILGVCIKNKSTDTDMLISLDLGVTYFGLEFGDFFEADISIDAVWVKTASGTAAYDVIYSLGVVL